ncbi:MAG: AAA family ATPase [Candidatus Aenigmatarchaeota archaeon]
MLIVVCGLQGTGKTTVAREIQESTDGVLLRTDTIRQELFKNPEYTDEEMQKVYDEMLSRAEEHLRKDENVVLDATFSDRENREKAVNVAKKTNSKYRIMKVECPVEVVRKRIEDRTDDESDADFEVYLEYRDAFDELQIEHVTIDNSQELEKTQKQLDNYF